MDLPWDVLAKDAAVCINCPICFGPSRICEFSLARVKQFECVIRGNELEEPIARFVLVEFADAPVYGRSVLPKSDIDIVKSIAKFFGVEDGLSVSLDFTVEQLINLCGEPEARLVGHVFPIYKWGFDNVDRSRGTLVVIDQGARRFSFCM